MVEYFFDTYALMGVCTGRPAYERFRKVPKATSRLNLMELHYILLRKGLENEAEKYYDRFLKDCVDIEDSTVKAASRFRLQHRDLNLSYVDCIGYTYSLEKGLRFLTGDGKFESMPGVEFVRE